MIRAEFSPEELETLRHDSVHHPHPRVRQRLEALYLKSQGTPHKTICERLQITKPTLVKYLRLYQTGGLPAVMALHFRRATSALAPYEGLLTEVFTERPPVTLAEASHRIEQLTGIQRSPAQVGKVLKGFGLKRRKVGSLPGPGLTDEALRAQETFRTEQLEPRLAEAKTGQRAVFFIDAAHFVHGAFLGFVWCLTRLLLPTPSGRKRLNVLAALNAVTHQLVTVINETYINSHCVCQLLQQLADLKLTIPITVVLDNARYQRCKLVETCAAALNIELLFLPTYSPHLNLIERFWWFVKHECLYNKHYPKFAEFKQTIVGFIETATVEHKKALSSLLSLKFRSFQKVNILIA